MAARIPLVVGPSGIPEQLQGGDQLAATLYVPPPVPAPVSWVYRPTNLSASLVNRGGAVAIHSSGQGIVPAIAGGSLAAAVALAQQQMPAGEPGFVQVGGLMTLADWSLVVGTVALFPRALYFLDPIFEGRLTTVPPSMVGQIAQLVGLAVSLDTLSLLMRDAIQL